jgi:multidrug resistance efflux pump
MKRLTCSLTCVLFTAALLAGTAAAGDAASTSAEKPAEKPAAAEAAKTPAPAAKEAKPEAKPEAKAEAKPAAKEGADEAAKPATHKVKKAPFRIEVNLDGVFEAQNVAEIALRPQEWAMMQVLKAADHGTAVKQGDLVLQIDPEKIDRAISDLRADLQLNEISMKQADQQQAALEKTAPLDMEANERGHRMAEEDWKQYLAVDKPLSLRSAELLLQMNKDFVEYQEEELRQLEKMYKADDLMEETEKIVLKRARDSVARAKFGLERAQAAHDESLKFTMPRFEEKLKDATARAEIEFNRAKVNLPLALSKQRLDHEKLKIQRALSEEKLKKLMADRELMTVKAPIDGVLYYGKFVRGKWSTGLGGSDTLRRGAPVLPNDVIMTVVQPRPLAVHITVPEAQLQNIQPGLQGTIEPAAFNQLKLTGMVQRVSAVPISAGSFDSLLTVAADAAAGPIVPGMACDVKFVPYKKADALTVPPKSVFTEELDPTKQYVYLVGKDGKPEKRPVTLGKRNEKQAEVLQGLAEGDVILTEKPKE